MSERSATGDWRATVTEAAASGPTIPGYEILAEIGRGGMGVVFKARQASANRLVALKVIRNGVLADERERARFRIEAEAAARLHHPNVVRVYEVGEHQGQPFFAMEFVEGISLEEHLGGQPQPAALAAAFIRTLALAVQHAHEEKIVHRDLKPANILLQKSEVRDQKSEIRSQRSEVEPGPPRVSDLCPLTSDLCPKIVDFGLAKRLDSASTALTHDGAVLGTPSYMAPEQAAGRVRDVGPATDVYALGNLLYEMLTGRPPFRGGSWSETIRQVLNDEPPILNGLRPDVPRPLETICLKCLEKDPAARYATARELADELERFLDGRPIIAAPLGETERLARLALRDGYEIVGEIGRGPRSIAYRAHDGALKQPVVLKVFARGSCAREEWEARIRRSGEMWSALGHPNVVAVKRAGWWDGVPYVVEEFVPQGSLASQLASRPIPVRQALGLVEQLAEIVSYVHRQGIVHGNLKPSNVLFAADGIPRIGDFRPPVGLMPLPLPADGDDTGGAAYLAPELVAAPDSEPRPHTDVYGLGAILYRLLAGRAPFGGRTARETLEQVRADEPLPLSRFNREVTPHLEAFCLRCLRKNPWRRYARTYDVLKKLREFQANPENPSGERGIPRPPRSGE
jgi:eukaryotic-like serine/threonine-protein kinase